MLVRGTQHVSMSADRSRVCTSTRYCRGFGDENTTAGSKAEPPEAGQLLTDFVSNFILKINFYMPTQLCLTLCYVTLVMLENANCVNSADNSNKCCGSRYQTPP